jgi:Rrf2 family protein
MTFLSKACAYGLRAVLYVAAHRGSRDYVSIREISDELGLSFHFLTKILQQLTEQGLMTSYRGPHGGVALAREASRVTLLDVVEAIDGSELFTGCVLGLQRCGERRPCPLHASWTGERARLREILKRATVKTLAETIGRRALRLSDVG